MTGSTQQYSIFRKIFIEYLYDLVIETRGHIGNYSYFVANKGS
jgi:hypothetical protein